MVLILGTLWVILKVGAESILNGSPLKQSTRSCRWVSTGKADSNLGNLGTTCLLWAGLFLGPSTFGALCSSDWFAIGRDGVLGGVAWESVGTFLVPLALAFAFDLAVAFAFAGCLGLLAALAFAFALALLFGFLAFGLPGPLFRFGGFS